MTRPGWWTMLGIDERASAMLVDGEGTTLAVAVFLAAVDLVPIKEWPSVMTTARSDHGSQ